MPIIINIEDERIKDANLEIVTNLEIYNNINFAISLFKNNSKSSTISVSFMLQYDHEKLFLLPESDLFELTGNLNNNYRTNIKPGDEKLIVLKMSEIRKHCIINYENILCEIIKQIYLYKENFIRV